MAVGSESFARHKVIDMGKERVFYMEKSISEVAYGMIAAIYHKAVPAADATSRRRGISEAFKRLLLLYFREMKSAGEYAAKLNMTHSSLTGPMQCRYS
ncbi:hypothetical protein [[Flexibacter] sp. ATCC 35208]|uniref:hypothetical protein n=1 Tax=[Flexibacter] sp. ATCC 35208 TaxID=1936242 RepID=UPI0009CF32BC|nr:hypothetical protein [[Flexibacter] sp. ATCC 35208]OMP74981.1 hypothetical protein BW716_32515 [[Flexibacter] sp. ATCC 35208]